MTRQPGDGIPGARNGVYGPRVHRAVRDAHRPTTGRVDLSGGACTGLPADVVERYFHASPVNAPFEVATARMICAGCPVLTDCLTDGIATFVPPDERTAVVRAGVSAWTLHALRLEARRSGVAPRVIAEREVGHMLPPLRGAHGSDRLRAGDFPSPRLLR